MKQRLRQIGVVLAILSGIGLAAVVYFTLPRTAKVRITGTEVKRMGEGDKNRHVRFVYTTDLEDKQARVFRNEDTGWGFPPYFKFNSGDIAAQASQFERDEEDTVVLVTYYGVRIPVFDAFPNIVSLKRVAADYVHIPIASTVIVFLFFALLILTYLQLRKLFRTAEAKTRELVEGVRGAAKAP